MIQQFSQANFTPRAVLWYELGLQSFGLHPQAFYAVQTACIALSAVLLYVLARGWAAPLWAGGLPSMTASRYF